MYEGFGLPVIEAMACGAPVITGGTGALAEIGGDAILPLDRIDADVLGQALVALADSSDRRSALSAAGLERAAQFSWDRAARESVDIYRETALRRRSPERLALRETDGARRTEGARAFQASGGSENAPLQRSPERLALQLSFLSSSSTKTDEWTISTW